MASPDAETIRISAIAKVLITDESNRCQERMCVSRRMAGVSRTCGRLSSGIR